MGLINMSIRVALVNLNTSIVDSIIIVNSLEDIVPDGFKIVEIPLVNICYSSTEEEKQLFEIIREIDPDYFESTKFKTEKLIYPGISKWSEELGFYED
jgi:hypothetical protein